MESYKNKSRIFYYDIRAFAIICVLSCHCFDLYVVDTKFLELHLVLFPIFKLIKRYRSPIICYFK